MSGHNITDWFWSGLPGAAKIGIYQRWSRSGKGDIGHHVWSWWNGRYWCANSMTIKGAEANGKLGVRSFQQDLPWRGLKTKGRA